MAKILLINPRKRKRRVRRNPSAAQLRARRKFAAMSRARAKARVKKNPKRRASARRAARSLWSAPAVKANPRRRRKRSPRRLRRNPSIRRAVARAVKKRPRVSVRVRTNPILPRGFIQNFVMPAMVGALGATLNDAAIGTLLTRLPAPLQKPELRHLVKGGTAMLLAFGASKMRVANRGLINGATIGALTCVLHDVVRAQTQRLLPSVPMGEYLSEVLGPLPRSRGLGEQISWRPSHPSLAQMRTQHAANQVGY